MGSYKILLSNLGYFRGIDGRLMQHLYFGHRHYYNSVAIQKKSIQQLIGILEKEDPDLCCFIEIDQGSSDSANFNQLEAILNEKYCHFDIENKYGVDSKLRTLPRTRGKSNAFITKCKMPFEKIYFEQGTKRLVYKIQIEKNLTLFFAHFSLKKQVRASQLQQVKRLMDETEGETIFLGDFNVLTGLTELTPLLLDGRHILMNKHDVPTFTFHRFKMVLDLCICSKSLTNRLSMQVIPQPFSDHAALLLELKSPVIQP